MFTDSLRVLLASRSPRRSALLAEAGIPFEIVDQAVAEVVPADLPVEHTAVYLARLKSEACRHLLTEPDQVLLAADSIVLLAGRVLGKPADRAEAAQMLRSLSGSVHKVVTGVSLVSLAQECSFEEVAEVTFYPLSEAEINYYIDNFSPFDKAGAYGIQEWIGLCHVAGINGNFSNIMGLPVSRLYRELQAFIIPK